MQEKIEQSGRKEISARKKAELAVLKENLTKYNTVIITSVTELPAFLVQKIRRDLKDKAVIRVSKRRVIVKLFEEQAKKDEKFAKIADFCKKLKESCAIIFSNEDIFKLVKKLQEKKTKKRAKQGIAKNDVVVEAGGTGLMPGPILTALSDAGIKAGLEKGKVVIKQRFEVKKGEQVSAPLADALEKLNILPITAKVTPLVAYDKQADILFKADSLEISIELQLSRMKKAYSEAFALMMQTKYFSAETTPLFLQEAFVNAKHLTVEAGIVNKESIQDLLVAASNQASMINKKI